MKMRKSPKNSGFDPTAKVNTWSSVSQLREPLSLLLTAFGVDIILASIRRDERLVPILAC